jgi:hypothetical protein
MKRWGLALAAVLVLSGLLVWGQPSWTESPGYSVLPEEIPAPVTYRADVHIEPQKRLVTGTFVARFVPQDSKAYFHLYPNVFRHSDQLRGENWEEVLGTRRLPGEIRIRAVKLEGRDVSAALHGDSGTILEVPIPSIARRKQVEAEIEFDLRVPYNSGRLSYNDNAIWLGNWLPILAVKEQQGWRLDPYTPMGDPFYSEMANYHVRVSLPEGYYLATSGTESQAVVTQTRPARQTFYEIDASNVRDFAMVIMDDTYRSTQTEVGKSVVRTWWQEGDDPEVVERLHDVAVQSIRYYGKEFGKYPYREYDVVKTGGFFGGMEYPSIVFIQGDFFNSRPEIGAAVVAHETAHQWFYGLVGSDEVREAWVDESLTDYATMAFLQQYDGRLAQGYIERRLTAGKAAKKYAGRGIGAWQPVTKFPDWSSYSDLVYSRGAAMLWQLREAWGEKRVHQALRRYFNENQYGLATGADVVEAFSREAGADAEPYFDYWLRLELEKEKQASQWVEKGKRRILIIKPK